MENIKGAQYYTWDKDEQYREYMLNTLAFMEPRSEEQGALIYDQLEEVNEIFFIQKGCIDIGFKINQFSKYVVRMDPDKTQVVIGAYNCIFDKKTLFLYKCFQ